MSLNVRPTPSPALESTTRLEYDATAQGPGYDNRRNRAGRRCLDHGELQPSTPKPEFKPESLMTWTTRSGSWRDAPPELLPDLDIGRGSILNQNIGMSYLAQCCGIQAEFQKYNFPQSRSDFPVFSDRRFNVSFVLAGIGNFSNFLGAFGGLVGQ